MYNKTNFFNNSTSAPAFGQSFSKTSNFGQTPGFGQPNNTFFGTTQPQTGTQFGATGPSNSFSTPAQPQPAFGGFSQPQQNTSLFGSTQTSSNQPLPFGQTATSAFGAPAKPTGFGYTQNQPSTSLFGQTNTTVNTGFGGFGTNTTSNVFGSNTSSPFGQASIGTSNVNTGSGITKYQPLIGTDTIIKSGQQNSVNTKLHCITAMKEYENKSLEELRLEDYSSNRKGGTSNVFGNTQPGATGGIFGANTQQTQQTTGLFGQTNDKSVFGAAPIGSSTFGQVNNTTFGQSNQPTSSFFSKPFSAPTSTNNNTFGGFGTTTDNTQPGFGGKIFNQPVSTNLFGQPAPTGVSSFNQPNSFSGFGTNTSQPNIFGTTASNDNKAFGIASATSNPGFTGFGGISNTNTTSGNLFNKPATGFGGNSGFAVPASNASGFGISNFGTANNTSSIFNTTLSKPATSTFSGFLPQNTLPTVGGNLSFNSGNQNLFGNKPGSLFGNTSQTSNNLFGTNTAFGNSLGGFGNPNATNLNNTIGSVSLSQQTEVPIHQQILSITTSPYGENQIFKDLKLTKNLEIDTLRTTNPAAQKAILDSSNLGFKVLKQPVNNLKVKPISSSLTKKALFEGLEEYDSTLEDSFNLKKNAKRLIIKSKLVPQQTENTKYISSSIGKTDDNSIIKNNLQEINPIANESDNSRRESWLNPNGIGLYQQATESLQRSSNLDNTLNEIITSKNNSSKASEDMQKTDDNILEDNDDENNINNNNKTYCTGIVLNRVGYYTTPALNELDSYLTDGKCILPNFTIGREGYGNVYFNSPIDITGINFDEIVHFRHKEVIIYPGEQNKPPIGLGLNREAQVTLDQVWPHDKTLHEPIKDIERLEEMDYEGKLRRVCDKYDIRFIEYRPETGSWVFKVKHFSKYGLSDSDEETPLPQLKPKEFVFPLRQTVCPFPPTVIAKDPTPLSNEENTTTVKSSFRRSEDSTLSISDDGALTSQASIMVKDRGTDSHKVQLMKASFFVDDESEVIQTTPEDVNQFDDSDQIVPMIGVQTTKKYHSKLSMCGENLQSKEISIKRPSGLNNYLRNIESETDSVIGNKRPILLIKPTISPISMIDKIEIGCSIINTTHSKCISDLGLFNARRYKLSFGPNNTLLIPNAIMTKEKISEEKEIINSSKILKQFKVVSILPIFEESIVPHLELQLKNCSRIEMTDSNCPLFKFSGGTSLISQHLLVAQQTLNHNNHEMYTSVLSLCEALWCYQEEMECNEPTSHLLIAHRKNVLSDWLENAIIKQLKDETEHTSNDILNKLFCQNIPEACLSLIENGEPYLALLLSQISGGPTIRQLIQHQLLDWQKVKADEFINREKLKLLMLISGTQIMSSSYGSINVLKGLHWLKALAIQLWYLSSPTSSVTDVISAYDELINTSKCALSPPYPDYMSNTNSISTKKIYDIKYNLLKLFFKRSHSIESIINPLTYTYDILDFRLSWLVLSMLQEIGYNHCSKLCEIKLHTDMANQLEVHGLWHWSIFILLHINDVHKRELSIQEILYRNVTIKKMNELDEEEKFIINYLGIPLKWIYWAKSVRAGVSEQYFKQAKYLLKAKQWWKAHNIITFHIAPTAIINDKLEILYNLITQLEGVKSKKTFKDSTSINQGQIIIDFLEINRKLNILKTSDETDVDAVLENCKPLLVDLCGRINLFACPTPKHRLCQSEIAQKLACFARGFFLTSTLKNPSYLIKVSLEKLPLPQEYAQQELRVLLDALITEVFK